MFKRHNKTFPVFIALILCVFCAVLHPQQQKEQQEVMLQDVFVKEGDTLWSVANHYLKDPRAWDKILKYNNLPMSDPNVILPGMILKVPVMMIKEHLRPAYLVYVLNQVKYRKKNTVEWNDAALNQELYNEDGLRTMSHSKANIKFLTGEHVFIEENSLIIVRPEKKQEEISLFSGAARASKTKVLTDSAEVNPRVDPQTKKSDYKTRVTPDKTTIVEVYEGIVDVTAQGKTVTLNKGFGSQVKFMNPPSDPVPLPPLPKYKLEPDNTAPATPEAPGNIPAVETAGGKFKIELKTPDFSPVSSGVAGDVKSKVIRAEIRQYHFQISDDEAFKNIISDEFSEISGSLNIDFKKRSLPDGKYFYRISYVDEIGFESAFSPPRAFILDTTPPSLEIFSPKEESETTGEFIHIEGKSDDGVFVKVNDKNVMPDNTGKFSTAISARKGKNVLAITARDRSGNETRMERTVYVVKTPSKQKKISDDDQERELPKWLSTPGNFALTMTTFLIIAGVLVLLLRK